MAHAWNANLADIYGQHRRALLALAISVTGRRASGEDALQDAFLRLCRMEQPPAGEPVPYVFRAVRNAAIDQRRRRGSQEKLRRRVAIFAGDSSMGISASGDATHDGQDGRPTEASRPLVVVKAPATVGGNTAIDPPEALHRKDVEQRLKLAIQNLGPQEQEVLLMRTYGDLGIDEIADITGEPRTTVSSRYHRALKKLRGHVGDLVEA